MDITRYQMSNKYENRRKETLIVYSQILAQGLGLVKAVYKAKPTEMQSVIEIVGEEMYLSDNIVIKSYDKLNKLGMSRRGRRRLRRFQATIFYGVLSGAKDGQGDLIVRTNKGLARINAVDG